MDVGCLVSLGILMQEGKYIVPPKQRAAKAPATITVAKTKTMLNGFLAQAKNTGSNLGQDIGNWIGADLWGGTGTASTPVAAPSGSQAARSPRPALGL